MKRFFTTFCAVLCVAMLWAQSPQAFKYQAVIRNNQGKVLVNQLVSLQISILQDNPMGDVVYMETHQVATNDYGIANITIGNGEVVTGVFADIPWGTNTHFVKTELDITGNRNYEFIGTSQLLSVPYALYAEKAGSANNANDDFDKDPTNELQVLSLEGNILTLSNGNTIDLSKYLDNTDQQTLSIDNNQLSISGGNTVTIDANNRDEIQAIQFSNDTLYLSDGGNVYLGAYWDNTDNQTLSIDGNTLSIDGGNSVQFDTDSTNEIQAISFSNDTLYLSNGGMVYLGAYWDNTDSQTLSIEGNELIISGGNSVVLSGNVDMDSDPTNELQTITKNGSNITLSLEGGSFVLEDDDPINEIQVLTKSGKNISLSDGGTVTLNDDDATNEIQTLTLENDTLTISISNTKIDMSDYMHKSEFEKMLKDFGVMLPDSTNGKNGKGGITKAIFSTSDTSQIMFSMGNLQYQASSNTWRFAEQQYNTIGNENTNISETNESWIDLFGWGTSGYHFNADFYNVNYMPYISSKENVSPTYNYYGYGPSNYMADSNLTKTSALYDWGLNNAISNGENIVGKWRTLTNEEWQYILQERPNAKNLYAFARIDNVNGLVLLPDAWQTPNNVKINQGVTYTYNTFSLYEWNILQSNGAIFLPATGYRNGTTIQETNTSGNYWTSTQYDLKNSDVIKFKSTNVLFDNTEKYKGFSVRLVQDIDYDMTNYSVAIPENPNIEQTEPIKVVDGAIEAKFSVSANKQVYFSQGNLLSSQGIYKFAENQYDYIKSSIVKPVGDWIDLFSLDEFNQTGDVDEYGGTIYDLGYKSILNGGNKQNLWRTLSKSEWEYLLYYRENASSLLGFATVEGVNGMIILPDAWATPQQLIFDTDAINSYSGYEWLRMEQNGAIFLPCTGEIYTYHGSGGYTSYMYRKENIIAHYWLSSKITIQGGKYLCNYGFNVNKEENTFSLLEINSATREYGRGDCAIRLVKYVEE